MFLWGLGLSGVGSEGVLRNPTFRRTKRILTVCTVYKGLRDIRFSGVSDVGRGSPRSCRCKKGAGLSRRPGGMSSSVGRLSTCGRFNISFVVTYCCFNNKITRVVVVGRGRLGRGSVRCSVTGFRDEGVGGDSGLHMSTVTFYRERFSGVGPCLRTVTRGLVRASVESTKKVRVKLKGCRLLSVVRYMRVVGWKFLLALRVRFQCSVGFRLCCGRVVNGVADYTGIIRLAGWRGHGYLVVDFLQFFLIVPGQVYRSLFCGLLGSFICWGVSVL